MVFSIDFGTTRCKVAYLDLTGKPVIVPNARGEESTPTVIYYRGQDDYLIGRDAVEQGFLDPSNCVSNFKLRLGSTESLLPGGKMFTPTDAARVMIAQLKEDAQNVLGVEVDEAVVTCPADFKDDSKQALLEACQQNGIKVLKLVPEPTAAGIAYALDKAGTATFIVFDWGGGTFDVSILKKEGSQIIILATEGIAQLGGNDIDDCIREHILDEVQAQTGERPDPLQEPLFFHDLAGRIESAKISLANRDVPVVAAYKGNQVVVKLERDWFNKTIDPLIDQTIDAVDKAVAAAGLTMDQVNNMVMVGGTSRMPYIKDRLSDHTGLYPKADIDPVKAIAYGGAIASIAELARQGRTANLRGQVIPAPDMFLQDVTAHPVGCCVIDDNSPNRRLINSVIIPKNTPIPCQKNNSFYLEHEDQDSVHIEILQGQADADRNDCLIIGEINMDNLPTETMRSARIHVEYTIDSNGMVKATVTDKVSGNMQTVSVDYKKGIKPRSKPSAA